MNATVRSLRETAIDAAAEVVPSVADRAWRTYRQVMAETWPSSREAMAAIGQARDYFLGELSVHARLLNGCMDWREFDADLMFFGGDPQDEAVAIAAERSLDAAKALLARLREYQRREELAAGRERRAS